MKQYRKINENGFFIEDVLIEDSSIDTETNLIEITCPDGFFKPRWDGEKWIEGATEEEFEKIKPSKNIIPKEDTIMLAVAQLDSQREEDKKETQIAIAELANSLLGGGN